MVRTKTKKLRGGHYGRGMKSGRGKGKRGGKGNAGLLKHKWIWTLKNDPDHFGVHGFTSHHPSKPQVPITLRDLAERYPVLEQNGFVSGKEGEKVIDLTSAGYTKLLATGEFRIKSTILVGSTTEKTIKKLSSNGITVETDGGNSQE